ncbi:MAG: TIGR01244 family sulfur transferase, partial [Kangiellaceae bacterium]|nr:TIGR01244 family sulfur transferase [Kangiellaceae bacterium]
KLEDIGIKVIINNRPDNEEDNQPLSQELKELAEEAGIEYIHLPANGRDMPSETIEQFCQVIDSNPGKIHAFCKTGTRSSILYAHCELRNKNKEEVLPLLKDKGYDVSGVFAD